MQPNIGYEMNIKTSESQRDLHFPVTLSFRISNSPGVNKL